MQAYLTQKMTRGARNREPKTRVRPGPRPFRKPSKKSVQRSIALNVNIAKFSCTMSPHPSPSESPSIKSFESCTVSDFDEGKVSVTTNEMQIIVEAISPHDRRWLLMHLEIDLKHKRLILYKLNYATQLTSKEMEHLTGTTVSQWFKLLKILVQTFCLEYVHLEDQSAYVVRQPNGILVEIKTMWLNALTGSVALTYWESFGFQPKYFSQSLQDRILFIERLDKSLRDEGLPDIMSSRCLIESLQYDIKRLSLRPENESKKQEDTRLQALTKAIDELDDIINDAKSILIAQMRKYYSRSIKCAERKRAEMNDEDPRFEKSVHTSDFVYPTMKTIVVGPNEVKVNPRTPCWVIPKGTYRSDHWVMALRNFEPCIVSAYPGISVFKEIGDDGKLLFTLCETGSEKVLYYASFEPHKPFVMQLECMHHDEAAERLLHNLAALVRAQIEI